LVETVQVWPEPLRLRVRTHGSVEPSREIDLVAEAAGRVRWISQRLEPGDFFDAGELLVELDPEDARLSLERAEAAVTRAESQLLLSDAQLARFTKLVNRKISSPVKLEEAQHAHRMAGAALRDARAARDQARRELGRMRVVAPFAGRVRSRHVEIGQVVARTTLLARAYSVDAAEVRLPIPVSRLDDLDLSLGRWDPEQRPEVILRADLGGRPTRWRGLAARIEGEIDSASRMLHLVARIEDPFARGPRRGQPSLSVGLFVEAELLGPRISQAVVIPRTALREPNRVFVVEDDDILRGRPVEVAGIEDDRAIVAAGLAPGDRVCVSSNPPPEGSLVRSLAAAPTPAGALLPVVGMKRSDGPSSGSRAIPWRPTSCCGSSWRPAWRAAACCGRSPFPASPST
jgi:RND family efflux transporter MFP subunit